MSDTTKYFTPNDFQKPTVDFYRTQLVNAVNDLFSIGSFKVNETYTEISVILELSNKIEDKHFLDFCGHYALRGKWGKVEYKKLKSSGLSTTTQFVEFKFFK